MDYEPYAKANVKNPKEDKKYYVELHHPHVLAEAIKRVCPNQASNFAVNIGAGDGKSQNDPVFPLFEKGYGGLAIEASQTGDLHVNLPAENIHKIVGTPVSPMNVGNLLESAACPKSPDFFKIDIDGYDGPILKEILNLGYLPKVIQMEINPEFPPPFEFAVLYHSEYRCQDNEGKQTGFYGASMSYAENVAKPFGYRVVYVDFVAQWTHDITLVHENYLDVAAEVFGRKIMEDSPRERFLHHPVGWSHFDEYGIDSLAWRYRTDFHVLLDEIWDACVQANQRKHEGKLLPFHLSC